VAGFPSVPFSCSSSETINSDGTCVDVKPVKKSSRRSQFGSGNLKKILYDKIKLNG